MRALVLWYGVKFGGIRFPPDAQEIVLSAGQKNLRHLVGLIIAVISVAGGMLSFGVREFWSGFAVGELVEMWAHLTGWHLTGLLGIMYWVYGFSEDVGDERWPAFLRTCELTGFSPRELGCVARTETQTALVHAALKNRASRTKDAEKRYPEGHPVHIKAKEAFEHAFADAKVSGFIASDTTRHRYFQ